MNKKGVRWLYDELPGLVAQGVLADEAAERLHAHYGRISDAGRVSVALVVCSILGATLIGLGIILVLAHNWEFLSRPQRTLLSFAPLLAGQGLVAHTLWRRPDSVAWREASGTFLALSIGTCIALISQTYQISGDFGAFLLTWLLLGLPLVYLLDASLPAALYMAGITGWLGYLQSEDGETLWFWPLAALVIPHIAYAYRRDAFGVRSTWLSWVASISLCIAAGIALDRSLPGLWIVIYSSLFAVLYLAGTLWSGPSPAFWQRPFRTVGGLGIAGLALVLSYEWAWKEIGWHYYRPSHGTMGNAYDLVLLGILLVAASVLLAKVLVGPHKTPAVLGIAPAIALVAYAVDATYEVTSVPMLIYNVYLLALGIGVTASGLQRNHLGTLNGGLAILAAWIAARFFESDMDFVARGLVFIILGAGFLLANVTMLRRRRREA